MAELGIRKWLKDNKIAQNDDEITYDNNTVYLKGRKFMDATPQADGSTYAGASDLANAYRNYQSAGLQNEVNDALSNYKKMMAQPRKEFSYNPNTDPQYKNAMQQALRAAQSAQNNTLANLRARGQGKSSYSETVANQIQQKAVGDVTANQLPQMIAQAYQRYMGEQQLKQQDLGNVGNYLNYANNQYQQGFQNERALNQERLNKMQVNLGAANQVGQQLGRVIQPKDDWSNLYNQTDAPLNLQGQQLKSNEEQRKLGNLWTIAEQTGTFPDELADFYGLPRGTMTESAKIRLQQMQIQQQNANTAARNSETSARNASTRAESNSNKSVIADEEILKYLK